MKVRKMMLTVCVYTLRGSIGPVSLSLLLVSVLTIGCSSSPTTELATDYSQLRVLGQLYGSSMSQHGGSAPRNEEQFTRFLESARAEWEGLGFSAVDELLTSPRDNQRLIFVYGNDVKEPPEGGMPWIAYEAEGQNDKRLIVSARGQVQEVTVEELHQLIPASQM
jgi:hypothetical protein